MKEGRAFCQRKDQVHKLWQDFGTLEELKRDHRLLYRVVARIKINNVCKGGSKCWLLASIQQMKSLTGSTRKSLIGGACQQKYLDNKRTCM